MASPRPTPLSSEELRLVFQDEDTTDSIVKEVAEAFKKEVEEIMGADRKSYVRIGQKNEREKSSKERDKGAE